ncbi:porin family protein [Peristeroidobacter soli]|jgi:opacity protein-like surface antigen|uniref:porin family protein n=1 Tax=Peristeroidobacter soli TaxID=2497877 RepID=UPI00101C98C1|nr:porin family protein [Peristeroidobacter soli]
MNRAIIAATLLALSSGAAYAAPENDSGFYLGGGVGQFNIEVEGLDTFDDALRTLDDDDTAWQAFIGWRLNPYISLQAAYVDFGRPEDDFSSSTGNHGKFRAELSGFAPSIIGTLPLGPVELSAKLGYYIYDLKLSGDIDDPELNRSDSGEDLMYGVGLGVTFFDHLHAKLEYEKIELDRAEDSNALWLTGQWRF